MTTAKTLLFDDPERINTCGNEVHVSGLTLCRGMGKARTQFMKQDEVAAVSGAAFAMRRELFKQLGGFDERFYMYMEDTELSLRARLAGYRIRFAPDSIVYHRYNLRFSRHKIFYQERNRYLMLLKTYRRPTLFLLLPALLLAEVVTWGFVIMLERRQIGGKLRAYAWPLLHWRSVLRARRMMQGLRKVSDRDMLEVIEYRLDFQQTSSGPVSYAAKAVFNPLFHLLHNITLAAVRW